jgi:hypothetical protein
MNAGYQPDPAAVRSGEDVVHTAYSFYDLMDYDGVAEILADPHDAVAGLVATGSTGVMILTGTQSGPVRVRMEIHPASPAPQQGWEEVAEVLQHTPSGSVSVNNSFTGAPPGLPVFEVAADSWYRVRVHARGRELARPYQVGPDEPIEEHLIQLWPESTLD